MTSFVSSRRSDPMQAANYKLEPRPKTIARFDWKALQWDSAVVDYERHPAYASLIEQQGVGVRALATLLFFLKLPPLLFKRLIRYEMIPLDIRSDRSISGLLRFFGVASANILRLDRGYARPAVIPDIPVALADDGCSVIVIPDDRYRELELLAEPSFAILEEKRGTSADDKRAFDESRTSLSKNSAPALFECIACIFEESGIMAAAGAYKGRAVKLIDINPQINDPSDSFWRHIFPDMSLNKIPDAAYFHRDASGGDLKAIIYFSDVREDNGPFNYVVGSNRLRISPLDNLLCEANDHNGLAATDPATRQRFAALPQKLRQKGSFGNDLVDESEFSAAICHSAWQITGSKGSIVLFDTKGIHRGGMVTAGQRRVITCVIG